MQWNRRKVVLAVPLIVLFVSVVGGWALSRSSDDVDANLTSPGIVQTPNIGTNATNTGKKFEFVTVTNAATGEEGTISPAGRYMVVNFWFSTCEPCKREMPVLNAASQKYANTVDFIGINPNDTPTSAEAFLKKYNVTFPTYLDNDGAQVTAAGVATFPATFVIDGEGVIVKRFAGEVTAFELEEILSEATGPQS
jgi:thiol-disulfide isomerase/thioredoxin